MRTGQDAVKRRRDYGAGSVYQRNSDGRWIGTIESGSTARGTRKRLVVTAKTEAECKRRLRDKALQLERGHSSEISGRATVKTWADRWIDKQSTELRPKTHATYASAVRKWIIPTIGHVRFDRLTPDDVTQLANAQRNAGLSATTAKHTHAVLMVMLRDGLVEGYPVPARILAMDRPKAAVNDRLALTTTQAIAVIDAATALPHVSRWVAALLQGMRQGECLGLTWGCVDPERGTLDVSWQLQPLPYLDRKAQTFRIPDGYEARRLVGARHLVRPKTSRGQRIIPLVPWMTSALLAWRDIAPASPHDLVWPAADGRPAREDHDLEEWQFLQDIAGVRHPTGRHYVTHEARHTTATLLLELGVDPEVIKTILGHTSIVTSRGYMHVEQSLARRAMEGVAERLGLPHEHRQSQIEHAP